MFQFYCPNGHLLQGQESHMGQQSQCPMCGAMFVVPVVNSAPAGSPPPPQPAAPPPQPAAPPPQPAAPAAPAAAPEPTKPAEPKIFHIPCPNGHVLETPDDILGQQALCPYCNVQFELRQEDSNEHRHEMELLRRQREEEMNQRWVNYSIRLAIGVGVMFLLMIVWTLVIKSLFAEHLKDASPIWGVLGSSVLAALITWVISIKMSKKKRASAA